MRYTFPGRLPEPQRQAWSAWFTAHGIDPSDVAIPGHVELHWDDRRIAYAAYDRDASGDLVRADDGDAARTVRTHQLEGHPLPPPLECLADDEESRSA